jgi:hypothetical protein
MACRWRSILVIVGIAVFGWVGATRAQDTRNFTLIVLPDTQFYSSAYPDIFVSQTQWIAEHRQQMNIVHVTHVGDIVDAAGSTSQWNRADGAMRLLEDPAVTGLPEGIPLSVVPGNHDEPAALYQQYFGTGRFCTDYPTDCRKYYGDGYPYGSNESSYVVFSAAGMDFIVLGLQYIDPPDDLLSWAQQVLASHPDRRAIIVSHYILDADGAFGTWGRRIFEAVKEFSSVFLLLSGHVHAEARRSDDLTGRTVLSLLANYQSEPNGGNGWLRILTFSPAAGEVRVSTYSPYLDQYRTGPDSDFSFAYDMAASDANTVTTGEGTTGAPAGPSSSGGGGGGCLIGAAAPDGDVVFRRTGIMVGRTLPE